MVAVTVIFARMHSKPLDQWTLGISLNATIAIFITAGKSLTLLVIGACISQSKWIRNKSAARKLQELYLFESVARGPLGAFFLLTYMRWNFGIASVGAVATILALDVDTFAQQVVKLDTHTVEVQGGVSFGLSRRYHHGATQTMTHSIARKSLVSYRP
jgi:hypothetical protein